MKTAIRNLLTDYYRADYFVRLQATFRISELTSNVPFAVRSAFRNDNIEDLLDPIIFINPEQQIEVCWT